MLKKTAKKIYYRERFLRRLFTPTFVVLLLIFLIIVAFEKSILLTNIVLVPIVAFVFWIYRSFHTSVYHIYDISIDENKKLVVLYLYFNQERRIERDLQKLKFNSLAVMPAWNLYGHKLSIKNAKTGETLVRQYTYRKDWDVENLKKTLDELIRLKKEQS